MNKDLANRIYNQAVADLHTLIKNHHSPTGRELGSTGKPETKQSIAAFAEAYGLSRQNLQKIFSLGQTSCSVGVYIRIVVGLGLLPVDYLQGLDAAEYDLPLRLYLCLQHDALTASLFSVRAAVLPVPADHV